MAELRVVFHQILCVFSSLTLSLCSFLSLCLVNVALAKLPNWEKNDNDRPTSDTQRVKRALITRGNLNGKSNEKWWTLNAHKNDSYANFQLEINAIARLRGNNHDIQRQTTCDITSTKFDMLILCSNQCDTHWDRANGRQRIMRVARFLWPLSVHIKAPSQSVSIRNRWSTNFRGGSLMWL